MSLKKDQSPSAIALAVAESMRRFDSKLSAAQIERIAADVDEQTGHGAALDSKQHRLRNGDEPVTAFVIPE